MTYRIIHFATSLILFIMSVSVVSDETKGPPHLCNTNVLCVKINSPLPKPNSRFVMKNEALGDKPNPKRLESTALVKHIHSPLPIPSFTNKNVHPRPRSPIPIHISKLRTHNFKKNPIQTSQNLMGRRSIHHNPQPYYMKKKKKKNTISTISKPDQNLVRQTKRLPAESLSLNYRFSGPDGTGKQWTLDNGARLYSGDLFTIEVMANRSVYLYLFQFDSSGQLHELLNLSGYQNHLSAGQTLMLPAPDKHFSLDEQTGMEIIHTIASLQPRNDLMARYQNALLDDTQLQLMVQKGIVVEWDRFANNVPTARYQPVAEKIGRTIACQGGDACRETFNIHHLARP